MAYQLQTLPQFAPYDPFGSIAQGYSQGQKANTERLNQQKLKKDLDNYDRMLNAELGKMLAATEALEASTQASKAQTYNSMLESMIKEKYGEQMALSDMAYKNAIGQAAIDNAIVAGIQADLARASQPAKLAEIERNNEFARLRNEMIAKQLSGGQQQGTAGQPYSVNAPGQVGLPPLPGSQNVQPQSGINTANIASSEQKRKKMPEDYLPPIVEESPDFVAKYILEPEMSEEQTAYNLGLSKEEGRQAGMKKANYEEKIVGDAGLAATENTMLDQMNRQFKEIPRWNKGLMTGFMENFMGPLAQEAKVYTTLKNGLVFENLGDLKGASSDLDVQKIEAMFPGLTFTDESAEEAIILRQLINDRKMEKLRFITDNPKFNEKQLEVGWNGFVNDNSIFDDQRWLDFRARKREKMSPLEAIADEEAQIQEELERGGSY